MHVAIVIAGCALSMWAAAAAFLHKRTPLECGYWAVAALFLIAAAIASK